MTNPPTSRLALLMAVPVVLVRSVYGGARNLIAGTYLSRKDMAKAEAFKQLCISRMSDFGQELVKSDPSQLDGNISLMTPVESPANRAYWSLYDAEDNLLSMRELRDDMERDGRPVATSIASVLIVLAKAQLWLLKRSLTKAYADALPSQ